MDLLVVIPTQLVLLIGIPLAERNLDVTGGILAADHEADLTGRVGRDRRVGVFDHGENFLAAAFELGDEREVKPLVFGYSEQRRKGEEGDGVSHVGNMFLKRKSGVGRGIRGGEEENGNWERKVEGGERKETNNLASSPRRRHGGRHRVARNTVSGTNSRPDLPGRCCQ